MKKIFFFIIAIFTLILPTQTFAIGSLDSALGNLGNVGDRAGTSQDTLEGVTGSIINAALTLVGIIFLLLMVYAGYLWMTARGEEDQISKAKKIISGTMIGLVLVLSAYAITVFVTGRFESQGPPGQCPVTSDPNVCTQTAGCIMRTPTGQTTAQCLPQ